MLLLSSLTSPLKALASAMTLICLSASLIYPYLTLQRTTLLTLILEWIQTQFNIGTELATKAAIYPKQYFNKVIDGCVIVSHALPNEDCLTCGFTLYWLILAAKDPICQSKPDIIIQTLENMWTISIVTITNV